MELNRLKDQPKHTRKRTLAPSAAQFFSIEELDRLRRPEIPSYEWRKGEALFGRKRDMLARRQSIERRGRDVQTQESKIPARFDGRACGTAKTYTWRYFTAAASCNNAVKVHSAFHIFFRCESRQDSAKSLRISRCAD